MKKMWTMITKIIRRKAYTRAGRGLPRAGENKQEMAEREAIIEEK